MIRYLEKLFREFWTTVFHLILKNLLLKQELCPAQVSVRLEVTPAAKLHLFKVSILQIVKVRIEKGRPIKLGQFDT